MIGGCDWAEKLLYNPDIGQGMLGKGFYSKWAWPVSQS